MKCKIAGILGLVVAGAMALGVRQAEAITVVTNYNGIGSDTTWSPSDGEHYLAEPVFVTNNATLTIQAGTVIRGKNLSNASLIISRGSKIRAMGTATDPIVFTCEGDNNIKGYTPTGVWAMKNNGVGKKWGGVILLGRTYITTQATSPNGNISQPIEGLASVGPVGEYGGDNDMDDSGEMHYVSIRYGGFILGGANEINGLSMGGVGRETEIDHIEVYQNADDAFEFFGGTVNTKYLVCWNTTDDQFDYDEGYRGKGQFMLAVQGLLINEDFNERSDKGTEYDGAIGADTNQPSTIGTYFNWTQIGLGRASGQKKNTCINLRDGAGARWYNSLWMDFGGAPALFEGDYGDADGDSASKFGEDYVAGGLFGPTNALGVPTSGNGYDHEQTDPNGRQTKKAELMYNIWWKMGTNVAFSCAANSANLGGVWGTDGTDGNKAFYDPGLFSVAALRNYYLDEAGGFPSSIAGGPFNSPCALLQRSATPYPSIGDGCTYYPVEKLDPRPRATFAAGMMAGGRVPPNDGFFTPVAFIGAFGQKNKSWVEGWTLVSRLGMVTNVAYGDYTGIIPLVTTNTTPPGTAMQVHAGLDCDTSYNGVRADWYLYYTKSGGEKKYYDSYVTTLPLSTRWKTYTSAEPPQTATNTMLGALASANVLPLTSLDAGTYTFTFGVDLTVNPMDTNKINEITTFTKSFTFTK